VLGLDIGGANTKAAYIQTQNGSIEDIEVIVEYFPIWKNTQNLNQMLQTLKKNIATRFDAVGVTITAELSDVYRTKREGIEHILSCIKEVFSEEPVYILTTTTALKTPKEASGAPFEVAGANWAATGWLISQYFENCIVIDVGSTSTSIIPIINGQLAAQGKTDLDKLVCGELVYTGSLRTNLAAIVQTVPIKKTVAMVSSELFALSGDVHIILGNINSEQYISETADGKGRTRKEALTRLARLVCADTEMLTEKELVTIAQHIYEKQIQQITTGLRQVYNYVKKSVTTKVPVIVTGLGKNFLAHKAAEQIDADMIMDLNELLSSKVSLATPAVGIALMAAKQIEEKKCEP
jgi:probable H4MPT-linked C1 transfer pathway protein